MLDPGPAGPGVRRVMERALTYLGVPPSPGHEAEEVPARPRVVAPVEDVIPPGDAPEEPEEGAVEGGAENGMVEAGAGEHGR